MSSWLLPSLGVAAEFTTELCERLFTPKVPPPIWTAAGSGLSIAVRFGRVPAVAVGPRSLPITTSETSEQQLESTLRSGILSPLDERAAESRSESVIVCGMKLGERSLKLARRELWWS